MRFFNIIFLLLIYYVGVLSAQDNTKNPTWITAYKNAEKIISEKNFAKALPLFLDLYKKDSSNANINYKLGLCYMNIPLKKAEAINYFSKAMTEISEENKYDPSVAENTKAPFETPLLLAEALMLNYEFEKSNELLTDFQSLISTNNENLKNFLTQLKEQNNFGKETTTSPSNMKITTLEVPLNSKADDFCPLISSDESVLIFASKRNDAKEKNDKTEQGRSNIYIVYKTGNKWGIPEKISASINNSNYIPAGLSANGKILFISKNDNGNLNLYQSNFDGKIWSKPTKLNDNINSKFDETNATLSNDGNNLYFTSNRLGGKGGYDIYLSKKLPNGEWGEAVNMGSEINTKFDEVSPYIHPDGYTFFFASKGHTSLGGYDLFFCTANEDNSWSKAINLGFPVNTTEDDLNYTPITDGKRAYYSSSQKDGIGESDIFQVSIINSSKPQAIANGFVKLENTNNAENVEISLTDNETSEIIGTYIPNPKNGKFLIILTPRKNHILTCQAPGYFPSITNLMLSRKSSYQETATAMNLDTIVLSKTMQLYPFEFLDIDTAINPKAETRLKLVTDFFKNAPSIIEIIGNNAKLSDSRVLFLKNHFIKSGFDSNRIYMNFRNHTNKDIIEIVFYNKQSEQNIEEFLLKNNYIRKL